MLYSFSSFDCYYYCYYYSQVELYWSFWSFKEMFSQQLITHTHTHTFFSIFIYLPAWQPLLNFKCMLLFAVSIVPTQSRFQMQQCMCMVSVSFKYLNNVTFSYCCELVWLSVETCWQIIHVTCKQCLKQYIFEWFELKILIFAQSTRSIISINWSNKKFDLLEPSLDSASEYHIFYDYLLKSYLKNHKWVVNLKIFLIQWLEEDIVYILKQFSVTLYFKLMFFELRIFLSKCFNY